MPNSQIEMSTNQFSEVIFSCRNTNHPKTLIVLKCILDVLNVVAIKKRFCKPLTCQRFFPQKCGFITNTINY